MSSDLTIRLSGSSGPNANGTVPDVAIEQNVLIPALPPLSDELVVKILDYLNARELATCSLVCRHLNILSEENSLWRSLFQRRFGPHGNLENKDFQKAYKDRHCIAPNFTKGVYASHTLAGHSASVSSLALSADGKRLVSGSWDRTIKVWDPETGACPHTLTGHSASVSSLALSADGKRLVSGSWDRTIKVWDPETGACLHTLTGHSAMVCFLALSADGKRLFSGSEDRTIKVWDLEKSTCLHTLTGHSASVSSLVLSADGKRLVSGSVDNAIKVWDPETGACLHTLSGHRGVVSSLALSADGKRLFSGSVDNAIKVWDLETDTCLYTLTGHTDLVLSLVLSADGKRLFSGSENGTKIKIWDFNAAHHVIFKEIACLFSKGDPEAIKEAMDRFSRMPKNERNAVYAKLYDILKPFANDYWGCAEHAFHDQHGQSSTLAQKVQAIEELYLVPKE